MKLKTTKAETKKEMPNKSLKVTTHIKAGENRLQDWQERLLGWIPRWGKEHNLKNFF